MLKSPVLSNLLSVANSKNLSASHRDSNLLKTLFNVASVAGGTDDANSNENNPAQNTNPADANPETKNLETKNSEAGTTETSQEETTESQTENQAEAKPETAAKEDEPKTLFRSVTDKLGEWLFHPIINQALITGDVLSAATDLFRIPGVKAVAKNLFSFMPAPWKDTKESIDYWSVWMTKAVIMSRFILAGGMALVENRVMEAFGRVAGILALPFVKLEDITLATGLSTAFCQIDLGLEGEMQAEEGKKFKNPIDNLTQWFRSLGKLTKEFLTTGLASKDRTLFPDFKWSQITELPGKFHEDVIQGGERKAKPGDKDRGHTTVMSGWLIGLGAFIGVAFGRKSRNIWNKLGGVLRNVGGIIGDYTLVTHPDAKMRRAGYFAGFASIVDAVQRFLPDWIINSINHLNCINNALALHYYCKRSDDKNKNDVTAYGTEDKQEALA